MKSTLKVVNLGNSSYHYFRNWIRPMMLENNIIVSFKRTQGYNGVVKTINIHKSKAEKLIKNFVKENECVDIVW